jgi:DNA-binding NarL/FixJ family response regulator
MPPIRILLADDHRLVRLGLKQLLDQRAGISVVGEAGSGFEAVDMAKSLKPDLIFMDISMPELNGLEATRRIIEALPEARVVILSMHSDRRYVTEALRAGAKGYLLKDSAPEDLLQAINRVMGGQYFLSAGVSEQVIAEFIRRAGDDADSPYNLLSAREREVLQLMAEGASTRQIADRLNLSAKTIESHRLHLMEKLDLHSVAELTRYAIREGLVGL